MPRPKLFLCSRYIADEQTTHYAVMGNENGWEETQQVRYAKLLTNEEAAAYEEFVKQVGGIYFERPTPWEEQSGRDERDN